MKKLFTIIACALFAGILSATNYTYTSGSGYWTNPARWGGAAYPGQSGNDTATFTNTTSLTVSNNTTVTLSDAYFRNPINTVTLLLTNSTLLFTNSVQIGDLSTSTGNITLATSSGILAITNGGNAQMIIGGAGNGTLTLGGGNLIVDQLIITNNSRGAIPTTNSILSYPMATNGTITVLNGFTYYPPTNTTFNFRGPWNLLGGTSTYSNFETTAVNPPLSIGYDAYGNIDPNASLTVSGPSTVFNLFLKTGWQTSFQVYERGRLTVNSNAVMNFKSLDGDLLVGPNANMIIDNASLISPAGLKIGSYGENYISGRKQVLPWVCGDNLHMEQ